MLEVLYHHVKLGVARIPDSEFQAETEKRPRGGKVTSNAESIVVTFELFELYYWLELYELYYR